MKNFAITDYFKSEDHILTIFDNLNEGIIAHDLNRKIFIFNKEAERITGYSREEVIGKDCHIIFKSPLCGAACSFCNADHLTPMPESLKYPINFTAKTGESRSANMSVTPMTDKKGKFFGILASLQNMTEIIDLKKKLKQIHSFSNIIGQDTKMMHLFEQIRNVSDYNFPVHIYGETGTGKELVANAIHNESRRAANPFVPINCGALPENLIESELFGHVKGSFTGAIRDKKGRFELANGGTIFLDEVAELSKYMQVKLLRVLQEGKLERVGSEKTITVNVRILSATNKILKKEIQENNFRDDLFYRLNVIPLALPPLRERKNDIPVLINHFLSQIRETYPDAVERISKDALRIMMDYKWPGNVRELQNAIQFAIVKNRGNEINVHDLPTEIRQESSMEMVSGPVCKLTIESVQNALKETGGNKAKTARLLNVGRATLYRFLNKHFE